MSAFSPPLSSPSAADAAACDPQSVAEELLRRARQGNSDAFATLCEMHRRRVWNVVASVTRKSADTDDLAQDALVRAWAALPGYRGEAPAFGAWLCRIALNAAHDYQKSAWRRRVLLGITGGGNEIELGRSDNGGEGSNFSSSTFAFSALSAPSPHEEALRRETARRVRAAVTALAPKERVPIWLVYFEEFSLTDVARMENVPESTIRSRVKKGLSRLQKTLDDLNVADAAAVPDDSAQAVPAPTVFPATDARRGDASPYVGPPPSADWKGCIRA